MAVTAFSKAKIQKIMQDLQLHLGYVTIYAPTCGKQLKKQFAIPCEKSPDYSSIINIVNGFYKCMFENLFPEIKNKTGIQ